MKSQIPFFILTLWLTACQSPTPENNPPAEDPLSGTAKMVQRLEEAHSKIDPMKMEYFSNTLRAERYKSQMETSTSVGEKLNNQLYYAYELLKAGKNEQAIGEFEKLLVAAQTSGLDPNAMFQIKRMLALAYVRLGEATNCIERYNPESCIMPIKGEGVYAVKEASRSGIRLYEELLALKPDDYESMWMLNFAYMTLGEYPDKVPAKYRLPEKAFHSDYPMPTFPNIADKIGVNTVGLSGGTCVDDFNNDGLLDIVASSWGVRDQIRFFVNQGDGTFAEKTKEAGLTGLTGGLNTQHADYNNDGWMDVLILRGAWFKQSGNIPNSLLHNNGDGNFTDVTEEAGLLSYAPSQAGVWADFNNDGWLDLFIGNESGQDYQNPCEFYFSNQDGTFTNRISETGLASLVSFIKGATAGDIDNDGWMDLYVSILGGHNLLLRNKGATADGKVATFENISAIAKVQEPLISFPCWMFDFNNDGWEDIFAAGFGIPDGRPAAYLASINSRGESAGGHPRLYINNQDYTFTEISKEAGLTEDLFVMGSNYGDLDNDGWLDCYLGTGTPGFTSVVPNKMYRNNKGRNFQDVTTSGGFGHVQKGHAVGFGDFDNDGDQDIFSVIGGAFEGDIFSDAFFLNPIGQDKSWTSLHLTGTQANRCAIGARVKVTTVNAAGQENTYHATVSTGSSFGGNSLQLEMGLGNAVKIKSIEVKWPNRKQTTEVYEGVEMNRFVRITEGKAEVEYEERKQFSFPQ